MRKGFTLIEVLIMIVICGILASLAFSSSSHRSDEYMNTLYEAWSELHPEYNLTSDEWKVLYDNQMLPEQANNENLDYLLFETR